MFYLKKRLKLWIDYLKSKAKRSLKKRLDFPFENKIETMDRFKLWTDLKRD